MEDSLKVTETKDGFEIQWDPEDPKWSFLNYLSQEELNKMLTEQFNKAIEKWQNEGELEH